MASATRKVRAQCMPHPVAWIQRQARTSGLRNVSGVGAPSPAAVAACYRRGQQQALRRSVRGLLALERGSPMVSLLPQIILAEPQIGDDLPQFRHQHIGRCGAFPLRLIASCVRWG